MKKTKILLIDDEVELLKLLQARLQHEGYDVIYLDSGKDAASVAQEKKPDLILLDIMMPGKDGYDVCAELKKAGSDTASIPVIIFTAKPDWQKEMDSLGKFAKADDYISKPFDAEALLDKIKRFTGGV
ncbi:MAG: response regulator [Candidatus Omnitrophica bacterium]|nr:response regulator [Candidatus Omnitrophota bacterium]MBL7210451.1 response regulator [Candidatus Omnitrophota bacterium]